MLHLLRPEVAALFELTHGTTRLYVPRLRREVDLTRIDVAQAEELVNLPGGFQWLRRKPAAKAPRPAKKSAGDKQSPLISAGPTVDAAGPAEGKE